MDLARPDGDLLRFAAAAVGDHLTRARSARTAVTDREQAIRAVLERGSIPMAFQPALRLSDGSVSGVEALARFDHPAFPTPDRAFAAAAHVGLGVELELLAIRCALAELPRIPSTCCCASISPPRPCSTRGSRRPSWPPRTGGSGWRSPNTSRSPTTWS